MVGAALRRNPELRSARFAVGDVFLATVGELCLSPVDLSAFTKLAPARVAGLIWGCGSCPLQSATTSGTMAAFYESWPLPALFGAVAVLLHRVRVGSAAFVKPIKETDGRS